MKKEFRTGTVAIVGRPNVGKSTLINALVGAHVAITSRKAQTTRHRLLGIRTDDQAQYLFVDTPGYQTQHKNALNRMMNRTVSQVASEMDVASHRVGAGAQRFRGGRGGGAGMHADEIGRASCRERV